MFHNTKALARHKLKEHGEGNFSCEICNKLFGTKEYLMNHMKSKHMPKEKTDPFTCHRCGKQFERKPTFVVSSLSINAVKVYIDSSNSLLLHENSF